jgi:hypothetical protein
LFKIKELRFNGWFAVAHGVIDVDVATPALTEVTAHEFGLRNGVRAQW